MSDKPKSLVSINTANAVTCYHARNDEWEDHKLQHSHEDLSREAKVLFVEVGEGLIFSDHYTQTDP